MKRREANRMDLIRRNENFVETLEQIDPDYFQNLSQGQHPHCFMLACSDSRVSPSVVTQAPLGTMFVHRNIANQVNSDDESLNAGLYYALTRLNVNKVIVKGHTGCGGIAAAADGLTDPELAVWLEPVRQGLEERMREQPDASVDDLARHNVQVQVRRIEEHPIYKKYGQNIPVEGYLLHLETGRLELVTPHLPRAMARLGAPDMKGGIPHVSEGDRSETA